MTSIFVVFWGVLEAVFESGSLFGDDRSLPIVLVPQSLPTMSLSELGLVELFSLAGTLCGNTWFVERLFDCLSDGSHCSPCDDSEANFHVCSGEDRGVSLFDSSWESLASGSLDRTSRKLDVNALSLRVFWLKMLSEKHATKNIFLGSVT